MEVPLQTCQKRPFSETRFLLGFSVSGIPLAHAIAPSALVDSRRRDVRRRPKQRARPAVILRVARTVHGFIGVAHARRRLLYSNLPDFMRGVTPINQLIYEAVRCNSEAPYVRPTVTTPATPATTPASLGPCLIPARLVTLRADTHTRGAPTGPPSRFYRFPRRSRLVPVHRGAARLLHATTVRPRVRAQRSDTG